MVALRAAGYKHGRTEFYAAEPRRIMEVTMADINQITPENFDSIVNDSLPRAGRFLGTVVRALSIPLAHR